MLFAVRQPFEADKASIEVRLESLTYESAVSRKLHVITGATGLLGSHLAEQLIARGERVRALVRPSSDTSFLRSLGVELADGDLNDPDSLRRAVTGADVVYHCAARVGDWGPWRAFQRDIID